MLASIIIRTLNEERYLDEVLNAIVSQDIENFSYEIIIVDSGSTDGTLAIAMKHNSRVAHIKKNDFTFGRSLNIGCEYANGDYLVFLSGHCIPTNKDWLKKLINPLIEKKCDYSYGRQIGGQITKFSENQVFDRYFSNKDKIPQDGFFCNNANAAVTRTIWAKFRFNETLTGLEDMFLAKQIYENHGSIGYVADSVVYHIHDETWNQIKLRYEREAMALQKIMPEVKINFFNLIHFISTGILKDLKLAIDKKMFFKELSSIIFFRVLQYYGAYKGNHIGQNLSYSSKMKYFYPRKK